MQLLSEAFEHNATIPGIYTCDGKNISPPLVICNVPSVAQSLVLIMDDPDVPRSIREDGVWDHWLVWNIPADITSIPEGSDPPGVVGKNTGGSNGYSGPCPPDREHRYFFRLYALNTDLTLSPETATKADVLSAMKGRILAAAELMGRYKRQ